MATQFPDESHDHVACVDGALERAEYVCRRRGARLTPLRRRILEIICSEHKPLGAYEILNRLRTDRDTAQPPTVYRGLEFLMSHGLVHKLESRNAYVGCGGPSHAHTGQFLICRDCDRTLELADPKVEKAVTDAALKVGFKIMHQTVEVEGVCPNCQDSA